MKKYILHVFVNNKGLFESQPKSRKDMIDIVILLRHLEIQYSVSKFNSAMGYWEEDLSFNSEVLK